MSSAKWLNRLIVTAILGSIGLSLSLVGCAILWWDSSNIAGSGFLVVGLMLGFGFGFFAIWCGLKYQGEYTQISREVTKDKETKEFFGMRYPFTKCARPALWKNGECLDCSVREFCEAPEKRENREVPNAIR